MVPQGIRARAPGGFHGMIPVRAEGAPGTPLAGMGIWRGVRNFEHATLCRALGLDPCRFYFDLPSSARGIGSNSSGDRGNRVINGYIMMAGVDSPVGKLTICWEGEKFADRDPGDYRDFLDLGRS